MKKLIAAILIFMLAMSAAFADLPDISGLSADELIELNHQIQTLLFSEQLVNGVRVPPGKYIIGEDIPAGTYRIEITGIGGYFDIFDAEGRKIKTGLTGSTYKVMEIGKMELEEGYSLEFHNSTFIFFPYVGVFH